MELTTILQLLTRCQLSVAMLSVRSVHAVAVIHYDPSYDDDAVLT